MKEEKAFVPNLQGNLRSHSIKVPEVARRCSGIIVFGRRIKTLVFTTDIAIIRNIDADAVVAVYPFTPQPIITQALLMAADIPVFAGVGGGLTTGPRVCALANHAEMQGAAGVVLNAPTSNEIVAEVSANLEIPTVVTIVNEEGDVAARLKAGADIINVAAAAKTASVVRKIREEFPDVPIMATGGPTDETILETIEAGANAISWTPPTTAELFKETMDKYRRWVKN